MKISHTAMVREATLADCDELSKLFSELLSRSISRMSVKDHIEKNNVEDTNNFLLVIEQHQNIIGTAQLMIYSNALRHPNKKAVIDSVIINEKYRGKGYGKFMINEMIKLSQKNDVELITLISGHQRTGAHGFYKALGFGMYGVGYTLTLSNNDL